MNFKEIRNYLKMKFKGCPKIAKMRKMLRPQIAILFLAIFLLFIPTVYAEEFDTNIVGSSDSPDGNTSDLYKHWAYYRTTGTRYVIRVYDWNSGKYIAVPKEYYINHVYGYKSNGKIDTSRQVMYLGVDKTQSGKYTVVKSGTSIFTDNTYSHILKWYDNSNVSNFGLTKNDVNVLAQIIKDAATSRGNTSVANSMQSIINGTVPYDVRAEILFLMKVPGTKGTKRTVSVEGKGSIENYTMIHYDNATTSTDSRKWRKEYLTYLEIKSTAYKISDDNGITMKATWLDKVACALYEQDNAYVFANGVYQCSCDLYKRMFGSAAVYTLVDNQINLNQQAEKGEDRWYMYQTPGRCGIPISISGGTYYLTPGKTYTIAGKSVKVNQRIKFSDTSSGYKVHDFSYLSVVTNDANKATLYEGWDYITSKMASILVIACDKSTGNIISVNGVPYSEFEYVKAGTYNKKAWDIDGYTYLGYTTKNNFSLPSVPVGVSSTEDNVDVRITSSDVANGAKKQVVFVYEKGLGTNIPENDEKEVRLSIYRIEENNNSIMYTGKYLIDSNNNVSIKLYNKNGSLIHSNTAKITTSGGYSINTNSLENILSIDSDTYEYLGYLVKSNPDYFLNYYGESLNLASGNIYNLKNVGENKVHVIIGYKQNGDDPGFEPPPEIPPVVEYPELKITYVDTNGNPIPGKPSIETVENINTPITTTADDLKKDNYMYIGHVYVDTVDEFGGIPNPLNPTGSSTSVTTTFDEGNQRRHIIFIYRKIDIKFTLDIFMDVNDLGNQYIGQKPNEDYWVLDEAGKVILRVTATGTEGLTISNYAIKLRIPFDTYMDGNYLAGNSINNLNVSNLSDIIIADKLVVPIWVTEKEYSIDAIIEANVEGFGIVSANKSDNVEVVGRLYDFTVTNIDGSDKTGDEKWKETLFPNEEIEYKAEKIPVGQIANQPEKYNYGIKLGTSFYYSINTKGLKNDAISITPKFLYVSEDGEVIKEATLYINERGKMLDILSDNLEEKTIKLRDENILKSNVAKEISKAQSLKNIMERYNYPYAVSRSIGKLSNPIISKYLSLPYLNYINEFKEMYGDAALTLARKSEDALLEYASHWYGKYVVPASSKIVDLGALSNAKGYEDGYLIVCFKIISLDNSGVEYLSYDLPTTLTQWQRENLNQIVNLPKIFVEDSASKSVVLSTIHEGYAPVIIYQIGVTTKDNNTSVGTH